MNGYNYMNITPLTRYDKSKKFLLATLAAANLNVNNISYIAFYQSLSPQADCAVS